MLFKVDVVRFRQHRGDRQTAPHDAAAVGKADFSTNDGLGARLVSLAGPACVAPRQSFLYLKREGKERINFNNK
jgi:hypothetical protein